MIHFMKKSLAVLIFIASILMTGTAWAAEADHNSGSQPGVTVVPEAAPRILELINRERVRVGLDGLALDEEATKIALGWTRQMALAGRISHNQAYLSQESLQRLNAVTVGENVAFASAVDEIHSLFMGSPPHRHNILEPKYRLVGIGAVRTDTGELYLTEDFLTRKDPPTPRDERPAPARPAPAGRGPRPVRTVPALRPVAARPAGPAPAAAGRTAPPAAPPTASPSPPVTPATTVPTVPAAAPEEPPSSPPLSEAVVPAAGADQGRPGNAGPPPTATNRPPSGHSGGALMKGAPAVPALALVRRRRSRRR